MLNPDSRKWGKGFSIIMVLGVDLQLRIRSERETLNSDGGKKGRGMGQSPHT